MLNMQLDRPLVFFDIESTGTVVTRDRIVELSVIKFLPDGSRECTTRRLNPEMAIPEAASKIHGIYDADVANAPTFAIIAQNLHHYLEGCDLAGYNIVGFDIPLLVEEFRRAGLEFSLEGRRVIDSFRIFCKLYPRTLTAAYRLFCGKELEDAHSAEADTMATVEVFLGQLEKHPELPRDLDELHKFCDLRDPDAIDASNRFKWSGSEVIVNFGKNYGQTLRHLAANDPGFLRWILRADFADDVKAIASNALAGKFPELKNEQCRPD